MKEREVDDSGGLGNLQSGGNSFQLLQRARVFQLRERKRSKKERESCIFVKNIYTLMLINEYIFTYVLRVFLYKNTIYQ